MDLVIGWPEGIFLALMFMNLGLAIAKHGKNEGDCNCFGVALGTATQLALLWWGGFFS